MQKEEHSDKTPEIPSVPKKRRSIEINLSKAVGHRERESRSFKSHIRKTHMRGWNKADVFIDASS